MSHDLYTTRLYWQGMRGVAKLHGHRVNLAEPPTLLGHRVEAVDYVPEVCVAMIMPRCCGWRDMTGDEIAACDQLLRELTAGAAA